jgi:hypothetical protein
MKILIIDSHKGSLKEPDNLHWLNAKKIQEFLTSKSHSVKLVWSYPSVNDAIEKDFDVIIFNHASHYSYVDFAWVQGSPNAKLFYITNEYNLGEPRALWMAVKEGRKYCVLANHGPSISKVVKKYTSDWKILNLNSLVTEDAPLENSCKNPILYYGSFRKDRELSFKKYLKGVTVSTHKKNRDKFAPFEVKDFIDRIKWSGEKNRLNDWMFSLYIEDEITHENYNHLANRFYEALNHNVVPVFSGECWKNMLLSNYSDLPHYELFDSFNQEEYDAWSPYLKGWREQALREKDAVLEEIHCLLGA